MINDDDDNLRTICVELFGTLILNNLIVSVKVSCDISHITLRTMLAVSKATSWQYLFASPFLKEFLKASRNEPIFRDVSNTPSFNESTNIKSINSLHDHHQCQCPCQPLVKIQETLIL